MVRERLVLCMKYGTAYPSVYVNVLFNAVRSSMQGSFRFICLTDNPSGVRHEVECLPIPDIGLDRDEWFIGGVWPKVSLFDRALHGLRGRALFIDLDMVILRALDPFFDFPGDVVGLNAGASWGRSVGSIQFGTGIFAFDPGSHPEIADHFRRNKKTVIASFRTEQAYAASILGQVSYWPDDWVISFKRKLRRPLGLDLFLPPTHPPETAKVLAFHGKPRPRDLLPGGPRFWDRFPHMGNGPVRWMVDYWERNGGSLTIR
jgi:hypothetical protein